MCLLKKNMENKYEGFKAFGDNVSFIVGMSVRNFIAAQCILCDFCWGLVTFLNFLLSVETGQLNETNCFCTCKTALMK